MPFLKRHGYSMANRRQRHIFIEFNDRQSLENECKRASKCGEISSEILVAKSTSFSTLYKFWFALQNGPECYFVRGNRSPRLRVTKTDFLLEYRVAHKVQRRFTIRNCLHVLSKIHVTYPHVLQSALSKIIVKYWSEEMSSPEI